VGEDYSNLHAICRSKVLVTYTCDVRPNEEQQLALADFVRGGGRWLALHATNSALERMPEGFAAPRILGEVANVLGSQFVAHPPIAPYRVDVVDPTHPLVRDIDPFEVSDELYLSELHDAEKHTVLLQTHWHGDTGPGFIEHVWPDDDPRPVLYLRPYGDGEVLYFTLGHCRGHYDMQPMLDFYPVIERGSWDVPAFRTILERAVRWATGDLGS
jgi:type 1 glutamine amidotransferase